MSWLLWRPCFSQPRAACAPENAIQAAVLSTQPRWVKIGFYTPAIARLRLRDGLRTAMPATHRYLLLSEQLEKNRLVSQEETKRVKSTRSATGSATGMPEEYSSLWAVTGLAPFSITRSQKRNFANGLPRKNLHQGWNALVLHDLGQLATRQMAYLLVETMLVRSESLVVWGNAASGDFTRLPALAMHGKSLQYR